MLRSNTWALLLACLGVCSSACDNNANAGWDWNRMRSQPRYSAYQNMRVAPAGTITRESAADDSARTLPANLERGREQYQTFCALCHGDAKGEGATVGDNMEHPTPPLFARDSARAMSDEILFDIVTHGHNPMPPFAGELSAYDRWQVVAYVQTLRRAATARGPRP